MHILRIFKPTKDYSQNSTVIHPKWGATNAVGSPDYPAMSALIHLIYTSVATQEFSNAALAKLLEKSRANNAAAGITGMLLYADRSFFQILEGETDAVERVFQRITGDSRHTQLVTIIREPIAKRSFAEWTMGYGHITPQEVGSIVGLNDFFMQASCFGQINSGRAKKLLTAFKEGRWRTRLTNTGAGEQSADREQIVMRQAATRVPKITVAYQPIVDISERTVFSFEALIRSQDEQTAGADLRTVAPQALAHIDVESRTTAIEIAARLGLSCNLNLDFVPRTAREAREAVRSMLTDVERLGIAPERLILELNQDELDDTPGELANVLAEYRDTGLRVAIDHFGAGRTSLGQIEPLRPDFISLSSKLVKDIDARGPQQAIVGGLIQTCQDLGIDVIAKDVTTLAEFAWLVEARVNFFQGGLFAKPDLEKLPTPSFPA